MDRKYRQRGYQDESPGERQAPRQQSRDREGPRSPAVTQFTEAVRCAMCGASTDVGLGATPLDAVCASCKADLHTCRNCIHFDPGARFECREKIEAPVRSKTTRNDCQLFATRRTVEKKTGESKPARDDPRAAFEKLFRK